MEIIGLDGYSVKRRHDCDPALCDLERCQVVGMVSGLGIKGAEDCLKRLPHPERVRIVVMDMHEPYRHAVRRCLPLTPIMGDRFHVINEVNYALDQLEKVYKELPRGWI